MSAIPSFRARTTHDRFDIEAWAPDASLGRPALELTVRDRKSGAEFHLSRNELMPLLKAVRVAIKAVEDAAAALPTDPVERAMSRVSIRGLGFAMGRAGIMQAYRVELEELRDRHLKRVEGFAAWLADPTDPPFYCGPLKHRPPEESVATDDTEGREQ